MFIKYFYEIIFSDAEGFTYLSDMESIAHVTSDIPFNYFFVKPYIIISIIGFYLLTLLALRLLLWKTVTSDMIKSWTLSLFVCSLITTLAYIFFESYFVLKAFIHNTLIIEFISKTYAFHSVVSITNLLIMLTLILSLSHLSIIYWGFYQLKRGNVTNFMSDLIFLVAQLRTKFGL